MEEQKLESIKEYLQRKDVQERIQQSIEHARAEATVTIGRMAQLFHMRETRIRDLEDRHLLSPWRKKDTTGQRQYSPSELEKLAIVRELLVEGHYSMGEIPENIAGIWASVAQKMPAALPGVGKREFVREADSMPIDQRVNHALYKELFWRYYASHSLYLALAMIYEEIRFTPRAGLILPLHTPDAYLKVQETQDLPTIGESLVGWLGQSRSFYTFLSMNPSFQYPGTFRVMPLMVIEEGISGEDKPLDNTLLVIPRLDDEGRLTLSQPTVEVIRRLLEPLYTEVPDWNFHLGPGMRDIVDPFLDVTMNPTVQDTILKNLANTVVRLGGAEQRRWKFCCILTPDHDHLPFQKRSLVMRAKSRYAPSIYRVGTTVVSPTDPVISISLRAYQGGRVIYHHRVTPEDKAIANREQEDPGSAIAIPIGGEDDIPMGVLYVAAAGPDGFNERDRHVLRIVARMAQELLMDYRARRQVSQKFLSLLRTPGIVDPTFGIFASETDFIYDVESLLQEIQGMEGLEPFAKGDEQQYKTKEAVSFIAVDIDRQADLTDKYGDRVARNLSRSVGQRIQRQVAALFTNSTDCTLYHAYADRYYLRLNKISLEEARVKANRLKQELDGSYQVDAVRFTLERPTPEENLIKSPKVTVRLGVNSYTYAKLQQVLERYLERYPTIPAPSSTAALIMQSLDEVLRTGQDLGGDNIMSWDYEKWGWILWSPLPLTEEKQSTG
jgi:GGDEF domain-containing protein